MSMSMTDMLHYSDGVLPCGYRSCRLSPTTKTKLLAEIVPKSLVLFRSCCLRSAFVQAYYCSRSSLFNGSRRNSTNYLMRAGLQNRSSPSKCSSHCPATPATSQDGQTL